ncbi:MAG: nucleotidyltransferase domain-containing protein [Theionarchaea archaeon]|nr:nucleotidyltransferase domain-containing protein [Theionarchaea archaeon]
MKEDMKAQIEKLKGRIVKDYNPEKIILFGSLARGDYHELSDVDMIIIKKTRKRFLERIGDVLLLNDTEMHLECFVYTPEEFSKMIEEENPFIEEVLKSGVVVYEK